MTTQTTSRARGFSGTLEWIIERRGPEGATVAELRDAFPGSHHGTISGALSLMHSSGHLAMLEERRDRCRIYVTPSHVDGRQTRPQGRNHLENIS